LCKTDSPTDLKIVAGRLTGWRTMNTSTQDKITGLIAAVTEHSTIYAAVKSPATPPVFNDVISQALLQALGDRITAIVVDK
jgi:hypothetical protein